MPEYPKDEPSPKLKTKEGVTDPSNVSSAAALGAGSAGVSEPEVTPSVTLTGNPTPGANVPPEGVSPHENVLHLPDIERVAELLPDMPLDTIRAVYEAVNTILAE